MKILFVALILNFIISCAIFDESPHEILQESSNSNNRYKAFLLYKAGNATVQNSLQVKVVPFSYKLKEKETGNIFVVDNLEGINKPVQMKWISNDTLLIQYNYLLEIIKQEDKINDIFILYELVK